MTCEVAVIDGIRIYSTQEEAARVAETWRAQHYALTGTGPEGIPA